MHLLRISLATAAVMGTAYGEGIHLKVVRNGKEFGRAIYGRAPEPRGGKTVEMRIIAKGPGSALTMLEATRYDRSGRPLKKEMVTMVDKRTLAHVSATFNPSGAMVTRVTGEGKQTKAFPIPKGASMTDASETWFLSVRPKPGAKVKAMSFSLSRLKWRPVQTTYVGPKAVILGKQKVMGHLLRSVTEGERLEAVVDGRGLPLSIEYRGGLRMVRIGEIGR